MTKKAKFLHMAGGTWYHSFYSYRGVKFVLLKFSIAGGWGFQFGTFPGDRTGSAPTKSAVILAAEEAIDERLSEVAA